MSNRQPSISSDHFLHGSERNVDFQITASDLQDLCFEPRLRPRGFAVERHRARGFSAHGSRHILSPQEARLRELSEDKAFQVVGLRYAKQDRVIAALHALLDNGDMYLRVDG